MSTPDAAFRSTLSSEGEFVLLSARTRLEGARRERWEALFHKKSGDRGMDWEQVLHLAASHRVLGLLGRHLSARSWHDVPPSVRSYIQSYFQATVVQSTALKNELADVCYALENASVPVVSFKGPTLALCAYGNAVVRPSADLDLLISRDHVSQALRVLRRLGYAPEAELSPAQEQIHLRLDSVFNLSRPVPEELQTILPQGLAVEMHWAITSPCLPFDLDFESVEPQLKTLELPGVEAERATVRALSPEDLLLILCVHGTKHLWERLIWLCDIPELVAKMPDFDWDLLMQRAQERGVLRMTVLALSLARDVLGLELPREVQTWFTTHPEALRLAARLRASLLTPPQELNDELTHNLGTDWLLMQAIDAPHKRIGFLWHLATTPTMTQRAAVTLSGLDFLWWVLRPAQVIRKRWLLSRFPHGTLQNLRKK